MKKLMAVTLVFVFIIACTVAGHRVEVKDDANKELLAWGSGQALGFAINTLTPKSDPLLAIEWNEFMKELKDQEFAQPDQIIRFHDQCVSIIAIDYGDEWGIMSNLRFLVTNYGARVSVDGKKLVEIDPVPVSVFLTFQQGYQLGKQTAQRVKED